MGYVSGAGWVLQEIVNSKLRDIPGDNFWFDSSTGDSGSVGGVYYRGLSCENCKSC